MTDPFTRDEFESWYGEPIPDSWWNEMVRVYQESLKEQE